MTTRTKTEVFQSWLLRARHGDTFTYFTGNLMRAREDDADLSRYANTVFAGYAAGEVALVQRRATALSCDYIAQRIRAPRVDFSDSQRSHVAKIGPSVAV